MPWLGSGTESDPYQIWTVDQLIETTTSLAHYHYKLMQDLDLSAYTPWKTLTNPNFSQGLWIGSLDGNNKKIYNITITKDSLVSTGPFLFYDYGGIFGYLNLENTESAYIKNLYLDNVNIYFSSHSISNIAYVGALAARSSNRIIENVHITHLTCSLICDTQYLYLISGLFADTYYSSVLSSSVSASRFFVYGISDEGNTPVVSALGTVDSTDYFSQCFVKDCYFESYFVDTGLNPYYYTIVSPFANLYGPAEDIYILNCTISSSNYIVGVADYLFNYDSRHIYSSINAIHSDSSMIYPFVRDTAGIGGTTSSYYESGSYEFNDTVSIPGVTGLTNAQMKNSGSYIGWDFNNIWRIDNV